VLTAPRRLLLVHAHPDDETLCTGGTIARYAQAGVQVTLVTCTLGEEGEVIPDGLRGLAADRADQLGGYRVGELRAACTALGVADHRYLGGIGRWRDSGMAGTPANEHPRAFASGSLDEQAAALAEIVAEVRPDVVVGYDRNGGYGHPDHVRAHQVMMAAAGDVHALYWHAVSRSVLRDGLKGLSVMDGLPFPVPAVEQLASVDDSAVTTTIDVTAQLPVKVAALRAHATQVSVWEGGGDGERAYALSDGRAQPLLPVEQFTLAGGRVSAEQVTSDLFGVDLVGTDGPEEGSQG
jgi:N-acetyl-1-D-myo-inositol-2-amino-2-deoxy-alpha-D-glucopyranoside deacetylase